MSFFPFGTQLKDKLSVFFAATLATLFCLCSAYGQGVPSISINDPTVIEGNGRTNWTLMTFTLTKTGTSASSSSVFVSTSNGTATAPADYIQLSGTVFFAPNETTKNVSVWVYGDIRLEADETFHLNLSNPANATISRAQGTGTILNDDTLRQSPIFDFDGDSITDPSVFRPTNGQWWITQLAPNPTVFVTQFGVGTDVIAPADFTGDNKTDIVVFRPSTGAWYVLRSEDYSYAAFPFGQNSDIPMPADFDGDGKADACVFRPSTGVWYILRSTDAGFNVIQFGVTGDRPVAADYDGDGKSDVAIYRPNGASGGEWWILRSSGGVAATAFGESTDLTVPGDWTGDGKADLAFWRPANGYWCFLRSEDFVQIAVPFGLGTDIPTPGDYDGDGILDGAVFRPSTGMWYFWRGAYTTLRFGTAFDEPVPSAFVH